jgi:hypothetical protein
MARGTSNKPSSTGSDPSSKDEEREGQQPGLREERRRRADHTFFAFLPNWVSPFISEL